MKILKEKIRRKEMSKIIYLLLGVLVVAVLSAIPLSAKENVKIKLPDGLYMYDAIVSQSQGKAHIGFQKYFVVRNNIIYGQRDAVKKFGFKKLNEMFIKNKKHKILLAGEKVGEIYIASIDNEGDCAEGCVSYKVEIASKNLKERPAYGNGGYGSAVNCIVVPEEYKEIQKKVHDEISKEEIDKISKLAKDKLLPLVIKRKALKKNKVKDTDLVKEGIVLLDKITYRNEETYIGIYSYEFNVAANVCHAYKLVTCAPVFQIIFAVRKDNVYVITSDVDEETLWNAKTTILGTLDVDGCGREELIIEKDYSGEDEILIHLEIYKQNDAGNWTLIQKNKWEEKR